MTVRNFLLERHDVYLDVVIVLSSSPSAVAYALGWPGRPVTIAQLAALALNRTAGWGSIGPTFSHWGRFKLGHGHPNSSNTGRLFFALAVSSFTNFSPSDTSRLLPQEIASPVVMRGERAVSSAQHDSFA